VPSLYTITSGALATSQDINQLVSTLTGNQNTPVSVKNTDPIAYTLQLQNTDAAGKAQLIYGPDGTTVLLRVQGNGVVASPDGSAAAPVVTTTHTQTLTNKTLTSPTLNTPTFGAGGASTFNGAVNLAAGVPIEDVSASPTVRVRNLGVVATSSTAQLLDVANMQALVIILCVDDGSMALYECRGAQNATAELLDSQNIYSAVFNTATSMNIYWSAGNARYELQNLRGASRTFRIVYFATG
jgi:hypothetical protein